MSTPVDAVLSFYCGELGPDGRAPEEKTSAWWKKDPAFDQSIRDMFGGLHAVLNAGQRPDWLETPEGNVAAVIVLDQFSRNMFRDTAGMFASDERALALACEAIALGWDKQLPFAHRALLYMPFMHSERLTMQERCVALFDELAKETEGACSEAAQNNHGYAVRHRDIVARFGRFPHRNVALGRVSTEEEEAFLKEPGSSF